MNIADPTICQWDAAPYLIVSDNIWGNFIYYSHLFPSLSILLIALFVFLNNPRSKAPQALFLMAIFFTLWSFIDLILWASERSDLIMFFWSILIHFELLIYVSAFYFIHTSFTNSWPSWRSELCILAIFIPLVLLAHTSLNLTAFDFTNCWREALEGPLWQYYVYSAEILIAIWIFIFSYIHIRKETTGRQEKILIATGVIAFLLSFSLGNILGSIGTNWELGQYGLFGMPIFVIFLTYLMVKYQTFKVEVIAAEALVAGLGVLVASLLFIQKIENVQIIAAATLLVTIILGILLVRSVRKEVLQRMQLEKVTKKLETANNRLQELDTLKSEFVSIASHQLRAPVTIIRGYASSLLNGDFGEIPPQATDPLQHIEDSSSRMALLVQDYLNISRIESGNIEYHFSEFALATEVEKLVTDMKSEATQKKLLLSFRRDQLLSHGIVYADLGKTLEIVQNLITNAIKYTKQGGIDVRVYDDFEKQTISVAVLDTGMGIDPSELEIIFEKFERSQNVEITKIQGSGVGLYIATKIANAMNGTVTAYSEGVGMGSQFTLVLPLKK